MKLSCFDLYQYRKCELVWSAVIKILCLYSQLLKLAPGTLKAERHVIDRKTQFYLFLAHFLIDVPCI